MKPRAKLFWCIAAFLSAPLIVFFLPLVIGIWLPDVFVDRVHVVGEAASASAGYQFRVIQYWNHSDFYTTLLLVTLPDGTVGEQVLDDDDDKTWKVPVSLDEKSRRVTVMLGGNRVIVRDWDPKSSGGTRIMGPGESVPYKAVTADRP